MARKTKRASKNPLIKKHGTMVMALMKATPQFRKKIIQEAPKDLINCVAECCHNVLKGNVPLSEAQKRQLQPKREHIRTLADKKVSIQNKKKILNQKGGFLPLAALIPALAPILGTVLGEVIGKI